MYYYRCHSVLFALNVLAYNISHLGDAFVLIADNIDFFWITMADLILTQFRKAGRPTNA